MQWPSHNAEHSSTPPYSNPPDTCTSCDLFKGVHEGQLVPMVRIININYLSIIPSRTTLFYLAQKNVVNRNIH